MSTFTRAVTPNEEQIDQDLFSCLNSILESTSYIFESETTLEYDEESNTSNTEDCFPITSTFEQSDVISDSDYQPIDEDEHNLGNTFSLDYMKSVVDYFDEIDPSTGQRKRNWTSVKHVSACSNSSIYHSFSAIYWKRWYKKQKIDDIDMYVYDTFENAHSKLLAAHDIDLQRWAFRNLIIFFPLLRSDNKLNDWGQALEAQFFLHLRKYIFPPAVLALKHAITEGCLFWFEKPLIVDALIQLLKDLCPANVPGHELCDCIPLFLGCLLSQCDVKAPNTDLYKTVNLITLQNSTQQLLQDPATQISHIAGPYELKERTEIRGNAKRHVDIRSLTQHLLNREHYYTICYCKRTDYLIYDSTNSNEVVKKLKIDRLNDEEITKQYKLMAKDYPSLTFITRGALRADIADQLIFLLDRTVALVFKKKTDRRITTTNRTDSKTSVESFEIFNPLQTTVGRTPTITAAQVYDIRNIEDKSQALPIYFTLNTHDEQVDNSLSVVYKNEMPKQITVVLLDRSRSVFEKFASSDLHDKRTIIDMSIIMLGILSDNIISLDHTPAFGLIHFGTSLETVCPITRNQDQFEKSLTAAPAKQEWTYGIDNHSVSSFDDMKTRIKQHSITIDFISFLRDELLQNRERHIVNLIKRLCEETHGYIYQQLPLTHIQLGATFEQEAAVWLIERDTKVFGAVSKPSRQKPLQLEYNAVSKVPNRVPRLTGGVPHYHRVVSEVNDVFNSHLDFIQLFVCRKDIFFWKVIMKGPFGTPYESGLWLLYANFGEEYPRRAPTVRFMTEIYHVNINSDGKICHQIFDRGWASVTTMVDAFTSIFDLLKESNFDDALSIEKTQLKRDQPDEYHRQAIDCTRRCAHKNLHELKLQFQLED
ncbi:unnamed protein product [Rotaria magnacalcarata]|uniref:UBC core domain-containing protein n=1 Tax=Rotaria magnacalcarata TaxID=392030 RepID=A0A820DKG1_9BILA|nr:unnamed protein product [Rotaria magnacalcarata]